MRKTKKITELVEKVKVENILCNKCGKELGIDPEHEYFAGCQVWVTAGYGSRHDGTEISLDLCDDCVDEFLLGLCHQEDRQDCDLLS